MTEFSYLAIAFTLIYSLAAIRLVGGLAHAVMAATRSVLHLVLTITTLFLIAVSFWVFYSLSEVDWTFGGFLVALMIPSCLYFCAATVIPEAPEGVASWNDYYLAVRARWYAGMAGWAASAAVSASINLDMSLVHPARGIQGLAIVLGITGALTSNQRVHRVLAVILVVLMVGTLMAQLEP
jgi:hypothetical protein